MAGVSICPDADTLQRFLLGSSSADEAGTLEQHIEACDQCLSTLHGLRGRDSVVEAIQAQSGVQSEAAAQALRELADRLKQLRPDDDACAPTPSHDFAEATLPPPWPAAAGAEANDPPSQEGAERTEELYHFLAPAQAPGELGRLGHYHVYKVLGSGGMGVVFQAFDPHLERLVALKAMLPSMAARPLATRRFLREAKAAAAIKHDHIVTIYQVGEDRSVPFLAMEFLHGESLEERLKRETRLPVPEVLRIGREMAEGLAAAHQCGLVHRDIKPGNVWLEERGAQSAERAAPAGACCALSAPRSARVKILDFGLARAVADPANLTQVGVIVGTPAYMAPEQADGRTVDARCDLFSLGCVLYRMATGKLPFRCRDTISTLVAIASEKPRPPQELNPELPLALCSLIERLLAKKPEERPSSATAVVDAIKAIERNEAPPAPAKKRAGRPRLLRRLVAAAVLIGFLGTAFLFGPVILRYAANEGELVIVIDDPQIQAVVDQAGVTIRDRAREREYKVQPGRRGLKSGEYVLEVTESGGDARLFTKEFTITRGGSTSVTVTFDRKALADATAARVRKPVDKIVFWTGKDSQSFADAAHDLTDVIDFLDLAGATPDEFRAWLAKLPAGFRLSLLSSRAEDGQARLNAVAVREQNARSVEFFPEMNREVDRQTYDRMMKDFAPILVCDYVRQGQLVTSQLWSDRASPRYLFSTTLPKIEENVESRAGRRPIFLHGPAPAGGGKAYRVVGRADQGRKWNADYRLNPEEVLSVIASCRDRGWRPDVLAPHEYHGQLRFMLVTVDNHDRVDWRFRMDMSPKEYQAESGEQRRQGMFPLALNSYRDDTGVRYAAIWVRYRETRN